jgi:hypothetical protein
MIEWLKNIFNIKKSEDIKIVKYRNKSNISEQNDYDDFWSALVFGTFLRDDENNSD